MFQKVPYGPAGHRSWCRSSLYREGPWRNIWLCLLRSRRAKSPGMGFGKVSLKGGHLQLQPDSCGALAQEGVELEDRLDRPRGSMASGVTVIAGGLWQGAWPSRNTRKDGSRWDWGSWFPCPWPGKSERSGMRRGGRALSRKFSGLILMPF